MRAYLPPAVPLTRRENQVSILLRRGLSPREISHVLGITPRTFWRILHRLRQKLANRPAGEPGAGTAKAKRQVIRDRKRVSQVSQNQNEVSQT